MIYSWKSVSVASLACFKPFLSAKMHSHHEFPRDFIRIAIPGTYMCELSNNNFSSSFTLSFKLSLCELLQLARPYSFIPLGLTENLSFDPLQVDKQCIGNDNSHLKLIIQFIDVPSVKDVITSITSFLTPPLLWPRQIIVLHTYFSDR